MYTTYPQPIPLPINPYAQVSSPYYNTRQDSSAQQSLIRVNGIDGARAYQMPPNSTQALFDTDKDILYIKTTDGAGFPSIRCFEFT